MSYGSKEWGAWVLPEEEALEHIKTAYDLGINTFDTAGNYGYALCHLKDSLYLPFNFVSNGASERVLGNVIKKLKLPRDEIVIMTKASPS
jgi:aryl-alcohol dehydrogenase-like predicted oxidoreductase